MAIPVSELAEKLGMHGVLRFREGADCACTADGDVLKLFQPQSLRRLGGRPGDRRLGGNIGLVLRSDLPVKGRPSWRAPPVSLAMCPIANFPWLSAHSALSSEDVSPAFVQGLQQLIQKLPRTVPEIERDLGCDFMNVPVIDQGQRLIRLLREVRSV
ncbi:hypothetical protein GCM10009115_02440 [Sphingopyxis soli]|jgi:hypothetical protein|uniref:Uncharacterized protein n=1 Tax=Sphingopyxis soli TaxID=592051 RepID=A0ABP3X699_9SPHN|nr:hypothetical protein [Sphingopyxis soli]